MVSPNIQQYSKKSYGSGKAHICRSSLDLSFALISPLEVGMLSDISMPLGELRPF